MTPPKTPKAFPRWLQITWFIALLAVPVLLWLLPADYFDEGQSICPSVVLFDTECPACGSTRAVQHLHHFELAEALYFHNLAPLIYLFVIGLWLWWTYTTATRLGVFGQARADALEQKMRIDAEQRIARREAKRAS